MSHEEKLEFRQVFMDLGEQSFVDELERGLEKAIIEYEKCFQSGCESGPFVIHSYVPFSAFKVWYDDRTESVWRIAFRYTDSAGGEVLLYGDTTPIHAFISNWFCRKVADTVTLVMKEPSYEFLTIMGSPQLNLANGWYKDPDFALKPKQWTSEGIPPVIGEVAYTNESLEALKEEVTLAATEGYARIAYGVKVSRPRDGSADVKLRFVEKTSKGSMEEIDFSPGECTAGNDPRFLVRLPLRVLFEGCEEVDEKLLEAEVIFYLFELQQEVLELLTRETSDNTRETSDNTGDVSHLLGVKKDAMKLKKTTKNKKKLGSKLLELVKSLVGWKSK